MFYHQPQTTRKRFNRVSNVSRAENRKVCMAIQIHVQCHTCQPWGGAISQLIEHSQALQDLQSRLLFLDFNDNV